MMCLCVFYILFSAHVCVCVDELRNCECLYLCMCVCVYICKCVRGRLSMHVGMYGMYEWYLGTNASIYRTLVSMCLRILVSLHMAPHCVPYDCRCVYLGIFGIVYS